MSKDFCVGPGGDPNFVILIGNLLFVIHLKIALLWHKLFLILHLSHSGVQHSWTYGDNIDFFFFMCQFAHGTLGIRQLGPQLRPV